MPFWKTPIESNDRRIKLVNVVEWPTLSGSKENISDLYHSRANISQIIYAWWKAIK